MAQHAQPFLAPFGASGRRNHWPDCSPLRFVGATAGCLTARRGVGRLLIIASFRVVSAYDRMDFANCRFLCRSQSPTQDSQFDFEQSVGATAALCGHRVRHTGQVIRGLDHAEVNLPRMSFRRTIWARRLKERSVSNHPAQSTTHAASVCFHPAVATISGLQV